MDEAVVPSLALVVGTVVIVDGSAMHVPYLGWITGRYTLEMDANLAMCWLDLAIRSSDVGLVEIVSEICCTSWCVLQQVVHPSRYGIQR